MHASFNSPIPKLSVPPLCGLSSAENASAQACRSFRHQKSGFGEAEQRPFSSKRDSVKSTPKLTRSVVQEAGLGRFVYLKGKSGKRYVFSSITPEQAVLYDNALFASTPLGLDDVILSRTLEDIPAGATGLYVHLLEDAVGSAEYAALHDLMDITSQ